MVAISPYLFVFAGIFLSIHFRRGRVCLVFILVAAAYYLMGDPIAGADTPAGWIVYRGIAVLLPFNLLLVSCMREKGVYGSVGRMRFIFLASQFLLFWMTLKQGNQGLWMTLTSPILGLSLPGSVSIPQPSLFMLIAAAMMLLARSVFKRSAIEGGFFGVALSFIMLLNYPWAPLSPAVFCGASTLIMLLALVQESYNMAYRDDLTGLPSRRALNEQLPEMGSRYSIAMVDVDHFKHFNDSYGHHVGDQVLKMVAGRMLDIGGGGRPFRYGGEEFAILFSGKGAKDATPYLERLRMEIADYRMSLRATDRPRDDAKGQGRRRGARSQEDVSVTVSIGLASPGEGRNIPAEVMKAADQALYRAKSGGRNRLCISGSR